MKKFALVGAAAVALVAVPALALQQGPDRQGQPMTRTAVQTLIQTRFAQADADRDGFITKAEAEARAGAVRGERRAEAFARLDANRDGSLSREEFETRAANRGGDRAERRANRGERRAERVERRGERQAKGGAMMGARFFERADSDKDGRISLAEASARPLARFDRADANRDGTITPEERKAARGQRQARPNG